VISGGRDDDTLRGGGGNDHIFSNQGQDEVFGDDGDDVLWSLSRYDVTSNPDNAGDTLHGGAGNDLFRVRDGEQDVIDCGDGNDRVLADFADIVDTSCETVIRKAPKPREDKGENNTQSPNEDRKEH
jgi:Ca2+-binding RTX toxin-like protein